MVRSKHFEIQLHKDGPLGDTSLECYNCGNKNSLVLGFIPAKSDSLVVLLCRSPCASAANLKDSTWGDANMWKAVIENRQFAKWMLRVAWFFLSFPTLTYFNGSYPLAATK